MNSLINLICSIYFAIAVGISIAFMSTIFAAGLDHLNSWLVRAAVIVYFASTAFGLMTGALQFANFKKAIWSAPATACLLIFMLGFLTSGFFGESPFEGDRRFPFDLSAIAIITGVLVFFASAAPALAQAANHPSFSGIGGMVPVLHHDSTAVAVLDKKIEEINLVALLSEFLSRKNNRVIFVGGVGTGKTLAISKLVKPDAIVSDIALGYAEGIKLDLDHAREKMLGIDGPLAFDEAQVLSHAGILLPSITLANKLNKPYIVALQSFARLQDYEKEAIFSGANMVKIIYFERGAGGLATVDDIQWTEISRYQAESLNFS